MPDLLPTQRVIVIDTCGRERGEGEVILFDVRKQEYRIKFFYATGGYEVISLPPVMVRKLQKQIEKITPV